MKMKYETKLKLKHISEKVVAPIISFFNYPLAYIAGRSENLEKAILRPVMRCYSRHSRNHYIQYTALPKNVETIPVEWPDDGVRFADYAIILQGPVRTEDDFTLDTVRYYKRCYPGVKVIVSTWAGSDEKARSEILGVGGILVESQKPDKPGSGNVNMQLTSSLAGMEKAKALGCKYAMKTRTDQRVCANDVLRYFVNLQEMFPSNDPNIIAERLVFISCGLSYRYLPFHLCDFVVFGVTDEMIKLYSIHGDSRPADYLKDNYIEEMSFIRWLHDNIEASDNASPYDSYPNFEETYYKYIFSESYIIYHYFSDNICPLRRGDDLMDAYYSYLKNYAIIADSEKVMVYWPKYLTGAAEYDNELTFQAKFDFKKWLEIYLHYQPKKDWSISAGAAENRKESV